MKEKIQKILSNCGLESRRNIEKKINLGLLKVNGKLVFLGERFRKKDIKYIIFNKKKFFLKNDCIKIIMYNKPIGEICTTKDAFGRTTVFKNLPKLLNSKWISVGRLDINTSGLLLFTNFGELAYRLMHPSYMIKREYLVQVSGKVLKKKIFMLLSGIKINNSISKFYEVTMIQNQKKNKWYKVSLFQGKNKEVRLLWNAVNITVHRLIRISYGPIQLPKNLKLGTFVKLSTLEKKNLIKLVNL
ncbi:pseudouridine synthase [Buchnera aphidicola]|uniref:pseudouridine synthase n=1 Tax=Buchnera aphidicola TaxID=9 RepID=UPI00094CB76A|nr:pseudouridine synthase [Buchnera aphidicola]